MMKVRATLSQHKERDYGLPSYRYRDRVPPVCKPKDLGLHAYRYRDRVLIVCKHKDLGLHAYRYRDHDPNAINKCREHSTKNKERVDMTKNKEIKVHMLVTYPGIYNKGIEHVAHACNKQSI